MRGAAPGRGDWAAACRPPRTTPPAAYRPPPTPAMPSPYTVPMRCFVVVPGALVPAPLAADLVGEARRQRRLPQLERLVARASVQAYDALPPVAARAPQLFWTWAQFGGSGGPVSAPYVAALLAQRAVPGALWHCDPVHIALARDHLLVTALDDAPPTPAQDEALFHEAAAAALELGAQMHRWQGRWFIAFDPPWQLQAVPLAAVLDHSMQEAMPGGADAARWRKLFTEIQIRWHRHPVNEAREAAGQPAINGLWLHGGTADALPALESPFVQVVADAPSLQAWAAATRTPAQALHPLPALADGDVLVQVDGLAAAHRREAWADWLAAAAAVDATLAAIEAQVRPRGGQIELLLFGTHGVRRVVAAAGDRWRLWRRQALVDVLAEPLEGVQ